MTDETISSRLRRIADTRIFRRHEHHEARIAMLTAAQIIDHLVNVNHSTGSLVHSLFRQLDAKCGTGVFKDAAP